MMCSPGVSFCFSNVTENVSERIWNDPSELRNSSHTLHGEGFPSAGLSISKYGSWEHIRDNMQVFTVILRTKIRPQLSRSFTRKSFVCVFMKMLYIQKSSASDANLENHINLHGLLHFFIRKIPSSLNGFFFKNNV